MLIIIISSFISQTGWVGIFFTLLILLPFYAMNWAIYHSAFTMLLRLKWLFLSIIILYLFLLPNTSEVDIFEWVLPVAYRVIILVTIIFSVNLLIKTTTKNQIISAVYLFIKPLAIIGIQIESFLVRAYLTLDFVDNFNSALKKQKRSSKKMLPFISSWFEQSINIEINEIVIPKLTAPSFFQWTIPVLLCFCYIAILIYA